MEFKVKYLWGMRFKWFKNHVTKNLVQNPKILKPLRILEEEILN